MAEYDPVLPPSLESVFGPPEATGAACLASGQFWASAGSLEKGDEDAVIEILEIKDQKQIRILKWSLNHLDKV
jgi:hypothetical protein